MSSSVLQGLVDSIVESTAGLPDPATLGAWDPDLSGDIDLHIARDGQWYHGGDLIRREGLVRLFASLLRREADGAYYLVTPVEKWRIRVEGHALLVIDCDRVGTNGDGAWFALLNTGGRCRIGAEYALHAPGVTPGEPGEPGKPEESENRDDAPWMELPNGLSAQLTRPAWYRLVDAATVADGRASIESGGVVVDLGATE